MTRKTEPVAEVQQLRALLTMSRELMQVDEALAALALAGRAMVELAEVDNALLLIRGEANESIGFDRTGRPSKADRSHEWQHMALDSLQREAGGISMPASRTMLVGVPMQHAMAVLVAGWKKDAGPEAWTRRGRILETILELSVATLGRISTRSSLEDLVSTQYEQMASTVQAHADELARRDDVEGEMRTLALTDVLTGLNNRRGFFVQAEHMFRQARRKRAGSAVIYADIDGLKLVNDQLGHETGDHLIRDAATVLRKSLRGTDVLARLGGDEFVAFVLDDAHPSVILARLRDNLSAFNLKQELPYRLSISAGVVQCDPDSDATLLNYVQLADREMYLHKPGVLSH
jgi:diguanylate cyclase (GGDEF)-like protein